MAERPHVVDAKPAVAAKMLRDACGSWAGLICGWRDRQSILRPSEAEGSRSALRQTFDGAIAAPDFACRNRVPWSESMHSLRNIGGRIAFGILIFAALAAAILARPEKWLSDFDQAFYLSIAYDLNHHGVFSNGVFDDTDSTKERPAPGLFFAPLYPALVTAVTWIDPRFRRAADCVIEAVHNARDGRECEAYARSMLLVHALLLALGVLAIARAAETIFDRRGVFWLTGILATGALIPDAELFSFVMTESLTFCLYSAAALAMVLALKRPAIANTVATGLAVRPAVPDAGVVPGAGAGRDRVDRDQRPLDRANRPARDRHAEPGVRDRLAGRGRAVVRPQRRLGRQMGDERGIRLGCDHRAVRL